MRAIIPIRAGPTAIEQVEHEIGHREFIAKSPGRVIREIVVIREPSRVASVASAG